MEYKKLNYWMMFGVFAIMLFLNGCNKANLIHNFEDCVKANNPILESYPRQCKTSDGKTFREQVDILQEKNIYIKKIETRVGELTLKYEDGSSTLSGVLSRSTPCVDWQVDNAGSRDKYSSRVEFKIFNKNKDALCEVAEGVLGEPQQINAQASASELTMYTVKLEDEVIFSGKLNASLEENKEILVEVPSSFSLAKGQSAKITNYRDMKVTFNDVIKITSIEAAPPPPVAKITVSIPGGCGPNADPRCLGPPSFSKEYIIHEGELVDYIGDIKLKLLSFGEYSALFKISNK